eukprot:evm.model.scf_770.4 EVM.evm.TU.scf_770.4   scf_770:24332-27050(-)
MPLETLKLLVTGRRGPPVQPAAMKGMRSSEAGLRSGAKAMLISSNLQDVQSVISARDLPGVRGFEEEVEREALRRRRNAGVVGPPGGRYTFSSYSVLEDKQLIPSQSLALKLLYRLASDPGIVGIMNKHRWSVGLLSEMPPEGKVGISRMCILGYNVNKGQEISLRLRTDDLKGFRKYLKIRETLVHELAHMVWSEHDNNFKSLNSQLLRECDEFNRQSQSGHVLGGWEIQRQDSEDMEQWQTEYPETVSQVGHTLGGSLVTIVADPRAAARDAALKRLQAAGPVPKGSEQASSSASQEYGNKVAQEDGMEAVELERFEHHDPQTADDEDRMTKLGSLDLGEGGLGPDDHCCRSHPAPSPSGVADVASNADVRQEVKADQHNDAEPGSPRGATVVAASDWEQTLANNVDSQQGGMPDECPNLENASSRGVTAQAAGQLVEPSSSHFSDDQMQDVASTEDPAVERYKRAEAALDRLLSLPGGGDSLVALQTMEVILRNALGSPAEEKYRRLRCRNPTIYSRVVRHPAAVDLLGVAGFQREEGGDPVLRLRNNDPGVLWLTLSVVQEGLQRIGNAS